MHGNKLSGRESMLLYEFGKGDSFVHIVDKDHTFYMSKMRMNMCHVNTYCLQDVQLEACKGSKRYLQSLGCLNLNPRKWE